jgi:hypothetical protein
MNGLKSELKTIVMTKEPTNVEGLRHCATLAEKAISSNIVNTLSQTVLEEIQTLKDQLKSVNIVQDVHHKLEIVIKISKSIVIKISTINCINHLNQGLIMFLKDLKIEYNNMDFKNHALFKVKDKIILIHKLIDPKGNQISNDINLLIIQCLYCGTTCNCQFKPQCPARNVVCHLCNKIGHFSRVCQSSRRVPPQ